MKRLKQDRDVNREFLRPFYCPVCKGKPLGIDPVWGIYYYSAEDCLFCNTMGVVGIFKFFKYHIDIHIIYPIIKRRIE